VAASALKISAARVASARIISAEVASPTRIPIPEVPRPKISGTCIANIAPCPGSGIGITVVEIAAAPLEILAGAWGSASLFGFGPPIEPSGRAGVRVAPE
jgi:hypothetical protein